MYEMRIIDECDMEQFGTLDSSEKTIAVLGHRWWPQKAKQQGDKISKKFLCNIRKKRNERPNVGGVSIRSRNGAPSRKGCAVRQATNEYASPPSNRVTSQPIGSGFTFFSAIGAILTCDVALTPASEITAVSRVVFHCASYSSLATTPPPPWASPPPELQPHIQYYIVGHHVPECRRPCWVHPNLLKYTLDVHLLDEKPPICTELRP